MDLKLHEELKYGSSVFQRKYSKWGAEKWGSGHLCSWRGEYWSRLTLPGWPGGQLRFWSLLSGFKAIADLPSITTFSIQQLLRIVRIHSLPIRCLQDTMTLFSYLKKYKLWTVYFFQIDPQCVGLGGGGHHEPEPLGSFHVLDLILPFGNWGFKSEFLVCTLG